MVDLITGDVGGAAVNSDQVATGSFEGQDWFKTTTQAGDLLSRGFEQAAQSGSLGEYPTGMLPAPKADEPTISAEEANAQFGQKSLTGIVPDLTFDKPLPAHLAAAQAQEWHDHVAKADAIARAPGGFWSGAARFGASTAVFMLDPLNLAASVIPVVSEARAAGALAKVGFDAGTELFGRIATRMATGTISGAVNQTPLIALRGGLSWADHGDYTAADAMADLVMGGAIGGGLHTVIGGVRDFMGRGFLATPAAKEIEANPVAREGAMRTAAGQLMDGRPVEINGIVNVSAAERAESELRSWAAQHAIVDAQEDAAISQAVSQATPPDRSAAIDAASNRVSQLQAELTQHQVERGRVRVRAGEGAIDPATAERINDIHWELAKPGLAAARRGDLEQELTMLVQGRDAAADLLESGRAAAQTRGLQASAARTEQALATAQAELQQLQTTAATEAQQAAAATLAGDRTLRAHEIAAASRRAVLQALQARSLRRFAGAIGAELQPGEAEELAQSINTPGGLTRQTVLQALSNRRGGVVRLTGQDGRVQDALAQGVRALRTERDGTLAEMSGSDAVARARGLAGPEEQALRQSTAQAQELAKALKPERPELPPDVEDAAAVEKQWKETFERPKPENSKAPTNPDLKAPDRAPDFKGGNADVWRDGDTVIRQHRDAVTFNPRQASGRILQPIETAEGGKLERLPFVKGSAPLSTFAKADVKALIEDLKRDGLAIVDPRGDNFAKVDGQLKVIDPGATFKIEEDAARRGSLGRKQRELAKEFGVNLDASPLDLLTAAERAEMRQMDEEFTQAKKDGDVWEAAASCMTGEPNAG